MLNCCWCRANAENRRIEQNLFFYSSYSVCSSCVCCSLGPFGPCLFGAYDVYCFALQSRRSFGLRVSRGVAVSIEVYGLEQKTTKIQPGTTQVWKVCKYCGSLSSRRRAEAAHNRSAQSLWINCPKLAGFFRLSIVIAHLQSVSFRRAN